MAFLSSSMLFFEAIELGERLLAVARRCRRAGRDRRG